MRQILIGFFISALVLTGPASAQLPPEIMVDKHLIAAEQLIGAEDYVNAFNVMKKIMALQKEHNLALPDEFLFKYAQVALKTGEPRTALDAVNQYLATAGKKGQFYKEALALLSETEKMLPLEPEMVVIPAGSFQMGDNDLIWADPVHEVRIASFEMSKYEVTFEQYDRFTDATGRERVIDKGWGRGRRPVIAVSWRDAVAYTHWLSDQTGKTYRLPTEAEWEYATRAGTTTRYSWGNNPGYNRANCRVCGSRWDDEMTAPVGSFEANGWGLHDLHGNVSEWVRDCWRDNYRNAPTDGSGMMFGDCSKHVFRGGSWNDGPGDLYSAERSYRTAETGFIDLGFRVVRSF